MDTCCRCDSPSWLQQLAVGVLAGACVYYLFYKPQRNTRRTGRRGGRDASRSPFALSNPPPEALDPLDPEVAEHRNFLVDPKGTLYPVAPAMHAETFRELRKHWRGSSKHHYPWEAGWLEVRDSRTWGLGTGFPEVVSPPYPTRMQVDTVAYLAMNLKKHDGDSVLVRALMSWVEDPRPNPSYEREALLQGIRVEREHDDVTGGDPETVAKIAMAHLNERPDYYALLARYVEKG